MVCFRSRFLFVGASAAIGLLAGMMGTAWADMVKLTQPEVIEHVSGKTETWKKGGAYYGEDGTIQVVWKGKKSKGAWQVTSDGKICMVVEMWGADQECHEYVNDEGVVKLFHEGNARVADIKPGNQLSSF